MKKYELGDVVVFTADHYLDFPLSGIIKEGTVGVFLNIEADCCDLFLFGDKIEALEEWNNTLQVWNEMAIPVKSGGVEKITFTQKSLMMQTIIDAYCQCHGLPTFTISDYHIHQMQFDIPAAIKLVKSIVQ